MGRVNNMIKNTFYTVQRIRKDDTLYGPLHGSVDAEKTICGIALNTNWYIIDNTFDGKITCKECLKIMKNTKCYYELYSL